MSRSRRLFISFSGGETSAFMTQWILANWQDRYDEMIVIFANTGRENEKTLEFVHRCSEHFGFDVVWVEADVQFGKRASTKHRVVSFETASRDGVPFEQVIQKYGIPNPKAPHCTRELKLNPMRDYVKSIGWELGSYDTAIGIRIDEVDRLSTERVANHIVYPLTREVKMRKTDINVFWRDMPFRLGLKGYEGNCKDCWKKTLRKHLTLMHESPEVFEFSERMERLYATVGPEFAKGTMPEGHVRTFYRGNQTVADLRAEYQRRIANGTFTPSADDADVYPFDPDLDVGGGCEETCEVFADEDMSQEGYVTKLEAIWSTVLFF